MHKKEVGVVALLPSDASLRDADRRMWGVRLATERCIPIGMRGNSHLYRAKGYISIKQWNIPVEEGGAIAIALYGWCYKSKGNQAFPKRSLSVP